MTPCALLLTMLVASIAGFHSDSKIWIPNTNFGNPGNWNLGRVPCAMDRVIFPSGLDLGVALPEGRTALRELVLSTNGEIILSANGVLEIGGSTAATPKCPGEDIAFTRSGAKAWLDPANWRPISEEDAAGISAVPHLDAIPCEHDVVLFASGASFKVQLPEVDVLVGKIAFGGDIMGSSAWTSWLDTDSGFRQFVGRWDDRSTAVGVQPASESRCAAKAGCACNGGEPQNLLRHVCSYAAPRCAAPMCYSPVTPRGHCCPICGAVLLVKHDAQFDMTRLQDLLADYEKDGENADVLIHAKKTAFEPDTVQVVIVERGRYQGTSVELATKLADDILRDMDLGVKKITTSTAGPMILGSKLVSAVKTISGTFIAVLVFLAITFYVFVVYKRGLPFGASNYQLFQFARFENAAGDEDGVLAIGSDRNLPQPAPGFDDERPSKSFDNPMYGNNAAMSEELRLHAENVESSVTQQNPIYSELKKRENDVKEDEKEEETDTEGDSDDSDGDSQSIVENTEAETKFHEISFDKSE